MNCTPSQASQELEQAASNALRFGGNFAKIVLPYMVNHYLEVLNVQSQHQSHS